MHSTVLILLTLFSTALSSPIAAAEALPAPLPAATAEGLLNAALGTAVGGALTIQTQAPVIVDIASPPEYLTITVINSHGDAISTSHVHADGAPSAVSGNVGPGTMAVGATAAFAVPTGWAGNVAINDAGWALTGDDSLIEGSFVIPTSGGYTVAVVDIDVSYVNGFSVAIVCKCAGVKISGCNKNLFSLNTCPDNDGENACVNPLRPSTTATAPTAFFAPCAGQAYTFPNDNAANSFGQCQGGQVVCCVGAACST